MMMWMTNESPKGLPQAAPNKGLPQTAPKMGLSQTPNKKYISKHFACLEILEILEPFSLLNDIVNCNE